MAHLKTLSNHNLCPLGLAGNPEQEVGCVPVAFEAGINAFFFYNLSFDTLISGVKDIARDKRQQIFVATGTEDRDIGQVATYLDQVRKALQVNTVDAFFVEYISPADNPDDIRRVLDQLQAWQQEGMIRFVGASVHDRQWAVDLLDGGQIDILMHRYNMAHRKSEDVVLPAAKRAHIPVVSFTNTRWGSLLKGHAKWQGPVPSAPDCYRFVLRHPAVKLAWMAPASLTELKMNLLALDAPRLTGAEVAQWKAYGDLVYGDGMDAFETRWP